MKDQESDQKEPQTERYRSSLEGLKQALLKKWTEKNIDTFYQNTILAYLANMEPQQAKLQIIREQEKLFSNRCPALKIRTWITQREEILANLWEKLQDEKELQEACQSLDQLRKINLKICQAIFIIKEDIEKNCPHSTAVQAGYSGFFQRLNDINVRLMKSYMGEFVSFSKTYDPFLLHPYERIEAEGLPEGAPEPIAKLFKMNISYVYRLIKAKNQLVKILSQPFIKKQGYKAVPELHFETEKASSQLTKKEKDFSLYEGGKKLSLSIHARNYQTQPTQSNPLDAGQRKFRRRYQIKSQPKTATKMQQSPTKLQQQQSDQKISRKFKIRQQVDPKLQTIRHRTEEYEITEDEDINIFRRKMMARRRQKRRRIKILDRRDSQSEQQVVMQANRKSLEHLRRQTPTISYSQTLNNVQCRPVIEQGSDEQQPMEPRGLEDNDTFNRRFARIKMIQPSRIKENFMKRKQKIRLEPLREYSERVQMEHKADIDKVRKSEKYQPVSPQIKQMNKESSSSNSDKKLSESDQAYTGKRQEQLFKNISKEEGEKGNSSKNIFRIKKVVNEEPKGFNEKSVWVQSQEFHPIEETTGQRFEDGHIRSSQDPGPRSPQKKISNILITKKFDNQPDKQRFSSRKKQGQSPTRLSFRDMAASIDPEKEKTKDQSRFQDFTFRQKYNNQQKSTRQQADKQISEKVFKQMQEQLQGNKKKQIKMKPGQIKLDDLYAFIQKQKINEYQRQQFQVGLWKENINLKHSYLTKFYMNSELAAFGISSPRCDGDYNILYWGTTCADSFTTFLFRKYLDYLQKFTNLNNIYIGSPGYSDAEFEKKGSSFVRGRKKYEKRELPYVPFLSLQCSNICFEQKTNPQLSIFFSEQIEQFTTTNSKPSKFIGLCDPEEPNIRLPEKSEFHKNINSIYGVNSLLEKLGIDTYATSEKIVIKDCKLFTLKDSCTIKSNYFYVRDGYFVPKGIQIFSKQKQKILKLQMSKQDYHIYFGKKFPNIDQFLACLSPKANGPTQFFAFKMFTKQLYGRIKNIEFTQTGCYGNWDINFLWQDQLKGTVIKEMPSSEYIFGPEKFHVAIYKAESLFFGFEVKPSDFFF